MYFKRIKDLREDNDLTQETIAKYLNITQRAYSYYEDVYKRQLLILLKIEKLLSLETISLDFLSMKEKSKIHYYGSLFFFLLYYAFSFSSCPDHM